MKAVLNVDVNDWTTQGSLPKLKRGTPIKVERVTVQGYACQYVGTVKIKGETYHFDLYKKEFDVIN